MDLSRLNPAQRQAVECTDGPVMILAGAGSGKTRTLVTRILYLLDEKKISPFQILALTFSNKAAREMRERVAAESSLDIGALKLTTFHSFCANLLRAEANYLGLSRNFTIYDDSETKAVVKTIMARRGINPKDISPFEIIYFIDQVKNAGHYVGKKKILQILRILKMTIFIHSLKSMNKNCIALMRSISAVLSRACFSYLLFIQKC